VTGTAANNAGRGIAASTPTQLGTVAPALQLPPAPSTQTVTFSGSLTPKAPRRTFSLTVGAGSARAELAFAKCTALTLGLSNGTTASGPSVVTLDATLVAGTYTYTVSGGRCSFTLTVTAPTS